MIANNPARHRFAASIPRLLLQLLAWPLLGFLIIAFDDLGPSLVRLPAGSELYPFLQWGLLTPVIVQLALRFPVMDRKLRNTSIHVFSAAVLCLLRIINEPLREIVAARTPVAEYLARTFSRDLLIYASIAIAAHLFVLARRRSDAERAAFAARANLAEAERELMEQTVSPETIVNSLDEIARRIRQEPARAEPLIEEFSEFLRSRISSGSTTR
jgi:hypothetical protein